MKDNTILINILKKIKKTFNNKKLKDLHVPTFFKNDLLYLKNAIKKNEVSTYGINTKKFEDKLKKYLNSPYVLCTINGTSALHAILFALKIKSNEEIFVQSLTFVGSINPIIYIGANPHFVDCEKNNLNLDIEKLEKYIQDNFLHKKQGLLNKKTKRFVRALIVTHIYGFCTNMTKLVNLCKKYKLILIEDAAESIGSKFKNKHLGTFGQCSIVSFNGNKTITTGGGGAILTKNKKIYKYLLDLITLKKIKNTWKIKHKNIGFNYRMPSINASLGLSQLRNLRIILSKKRKVYQIYKKIFNRETVIKLFENKYNSRNNFWLIAGYIDSKKLNLKYIISEARKLNIQIKPIWTLNHKMENLKKYPRMNLDNSLKLEKKILCFPSSPTLINEK